MALRWSQNGEKTRKKSQRNKTVGGVPRRRLILIEHGANMAPTCEFQNGANMPKNRSRNRSFFRCLSGPIFRLILVYFRFQNEATLATKWDEKTNDLTIWKR